MTEGDNASSCSHQMCWKKRVNRAEEHKQNEGNWPGQPPGSQINTACLKQRVAGASALVDTNSLSLIALLGSKMLTLNKQEITVMKCTGRCSMLL